MGQVGSSRSPRLGGVGVGSPKTSSPTKSYQNYNPKLVSRARELRKNSTLGEILLWEKIKNRQLLDYKFRRQTIIGNYIVDLYCKELQLVIEVDGISHDYKIEYDKQRDEYLQRCGITILHFNDTEVKQNINIIIQRIMDWINERQPTPTPPKRGLE